jgi:DNA polymerase III delta subunit
MSDPREQNIRVALAEHLAKIIKRQPYTERHIVQILRATPDKAKAIVEGQLGEFSTQELRRIIEVLT